MNSVKASAPGNLFFLGEHAVVYGCPAINTAVNKRTVAIASERTDNRVEVESAFYGKANALLQNGKLVERKFEEKGLDSMLDLCESTLNAFELRSGFNLKIDSEIPVESGMSSSTAVLSASFKAITELFGQKVKLEKYFDYLYPHQVKIHGGKASGSEIASSAFGGFNRVQKITLPDGKAKLDFKSLGNQEFQVVIGNTKIRSPTGLVVGTHHPSLFARWKDQTDKAIKDIEKLSKKMQSAIKKGNAEAVGKIMNKNHKILRDKFLVSHPKLEDCINEALKAGALGAKLSGAGWGGVMFALVTPESKEAVVKAIQSTGSEAISTQIGVEGVRLE